MSSSNKTDRSRATDRESLCNTKNATEDRSFHLLDDHRDPLPPLPPLFELGTKKKKQSLTRPKSNRKRSKTQTLLSSAGKSNNWREFRFENRPGPFHFILEHLSSKVVITGGRYLPSRNRLDGGRRAPFNFTTDHVSTIAASLPNRTSFLESSSVSPPLAGGGLYLILFARSLGPAPVDRPQITEIIKNC